MKYGFYELQSVCDWYCEVTADIGMHADLVQYWISIAVLLASPIALHFAEHIWRGILQHPTMIQHALWPTPARPAVDTPTIEVGAYMHTLVKNVCNTELTLLKKLGKAKGRPLLFDPKKPCAFATQPCCNSREMRHLIHAAPTTPESAKCAGATSPSLSPSPQPRQSACTLRPDAPNVDNSLPLGYPPEGVDLVQ
jgi:hypothetical protein